MLCADVLRNSKAILRWPKLCMLFKIMKNDSNRATDAAYFRLRFSHSKPSIFSIFFSPGEDYYSKPYSNLISYRFNVGNKELENYYNLKPELNKID